MGRLFYLDGAQVKELTIGTNDRPLGLFLKGFGEDRSRELYVLGSTNLGPSGTGGKVLKIVGGSSTNGAAKNEFVVRNLVSDQPGMADLTDAKLLNPWGLAFNSTGPFWISDNHSGFSTLYNSTGGVQALTVSIPPPPGSTNPGGADRHRLQRHDKFCPAKWTSAVYFRHGGWNYRGMGQRLQRGAEGG